MKLLTDDEVERQVAIAELLTAPWCVLDDFSSSVQRQVSEMSGSERQTLEPPRTQLLAGLEMVVGNTFATERIHSRNLRRRTGRVQTHHVMLHDLATFHMGRHEPPYAHAAFRRDGQDIHKDRGQQTVGVSWL